MQQGMRIGERRSWNHKSSPSLRPRPFGDLIAGPWLSCPREVNTQTLAAVALNGSARLWSHLIYIMLQLICKIS
jgi:hypothetical protein